MDISFLPLFLITFLAFIVPLFVSWAADKTKIAIPIVVGEIICGIIIGKSGLGLIHNISAIPWLNFLYLFGFTYLMFLSGLEVDINTILNKNGNREDSHIKKSTNLILSFIYFLFTIILAYAASYFLHRQGFVQNTVMMTLILSTTSVGIVVPVLKEKFIIKTDLGQSILLSALIADFLTMILITAYVSRNASTKFSSHTLLILLVMALIVLLYRLHISKKLDYIIALLLKLKNKLNILSHSTSQIKVRGAIALMVFFIAASEMIGIEMILGAFLAGILMTLMLGEDKTEELEMKLDAIGYGFFIPIFFISVGINLDLHIFFSTHGVWFLLFFILIAAFLIKLIPSIIFCFKYTLKESMSAGILLSSRLSLIIAAATIGVREGYISEQVNATLIIVAVCLCILAPVIFNKIYPLIEHKGK